MPHPHDATLAAACRALHRRRYAEAETLTRKVLARQPYQTSAMSILAATLAATGHAPEALDIAARAVRLAPASVEAHWAQPEALLAAGLVEQPQQVAARMNALLAQILKC